MPVYNGEQFLRTSIESILAQTQRNFELLVVDDASTDSTPKLLDYYSDNDERLQLLTCSHQGAGAARNLALAHATGDAIFFLDVDDYLPQNFLEDALMKLDTVSADMLMVPYCYFDSSPEDAGNPVMDYVADEGLYEGSACAPLLYDIAYFACTRIYRRTFMAAHNIAFGEGYIYEDNPPFVNAVLNAQRIVVSHKPVYSVRRNVNSLSRSSYDYCFAPSSLIWLYSRTASG